MKNTFSKIKNFVQKNKWWSVLIAIVFVVLIIIIFAGKKLPALESVTVEKRSVIEKVSATGNVKPFSDLNLSFEVSGKITNVYANVGDKVYKGQAIIQLDSSEIYANYSQALANLSAEQSRLLEVQRGSRPEELTISKSLLDDTKTTLEDKIADAYTKADDAIRNNTDQMFDNPRGPNVKINIFINNFQLENDLLIARQDIEFILNDWNIKGSTLPIKTTYSNLDKIKVFLDNLALGVNALNTNSNISQAIIDKYKAALSSARSSVGAAYSNLNIADSSFNSAKLNYDLKIAGNTLEAISAQEAKVAQMQAQVDAAKAQLAKRVIYAPITGLIVKQEAKVGEIATPNNIIVSVISYGEYEVESFIPEADIAKVKVGDLASSTLDAYGSDTFFDTEVIKIDPGETVIENVPTYKVTLRFASSSDSRIKSGMTANLDILTNSRINVLAVPSRSVYSIDNKKYVKLIDLHDLSDLKNVIEKEVVTGIRGVDGYIEIVSGIKEGDKILASPNL